MEQPRMRKLKVVTIREDLLVITGDWLSAVILNQMIFWQDVVDRMDRSNYQALQMAQKIGDERQAQELEKQMRYGWFWKSAQEMTEELMGIASRQTVNNRMNDLAKAIYLFKKNPEKGGNRSNWWQVNLVKINEDLQEKGYMLHGWHPENL